VRTAPDPFFLVFSTFVSSLGKRTSPTKDPFLPSLPLRWMFSNPCHSLLFSCPFAAVSEFIICTSQNGGNDLPPYPSPGRPRRQKKETWGGGGAWLPLPFFPILRQPLGPLKVFFPASRSDFTLSLISLLFILEKDWRSFLVRVSLKSIFLSSLFTRRRDGSHFPFSLAPVWEVLSPA